jgi:hypothetical protein
MKEENKLEAYNISNREADVAYLECVQATQSYNDYMDAFYFEEAGEGNDQNIVQKLIEKIKKLAESIAKFFSDFFASAKAKLFKQKADEALEDKELAAKKVEVLDAGRIVKFTKTYQKRISEAKSVEEIDKIVAEYEKKRNVAGVFAVTATIAAAIGVYVHHAQNHIKKAKEVNDYGQALLAKEQKAMNEQIKLGKNISERARAEAQATGKAVSTHDRLKNDSIFGDAYQDAKKTASDLKAEREAYKNSKGYKKYVANEPSKLERLAARKANALAKITSDGMNAVKGAFTSGISKIREGIGNAKQASEAKSFNKLVGAHTESAEDGDFGDEGSYFFGEIQMESGDMSTEDLFGVDPFSESADELFEESSLSDIGSKISNAIKKLIEKIKKLYDDVKAKFEVAKLKAVLTCKAASSNRQIKYNMKDKDISKRTKEITIAWNKYTIQIKKIEQAYTRGKLTSDQANDQIDIANVDLEKEVERIDTSPYGQNANMKLWNPYTANQVRSYCMKLSNFQEKTLTALKKSIDTEMYRLEKEAAELERAQAQAAAELAAEAKRKASFKYKVSQAYARANKKVLGSVVGVIGLASAIGAFAAQLKLNSGNGKAVHESAEDEISSEVDPFAEAADVATAFENDSFMEETAEASEEHDDAYLEAVEAALAFERGEDLDSGESFAEGADESFDDDSLFTESAEEAILDDEMDDLFDLV